MSGPARGPLLLRLLLRLAEVQIRRPWLIILMVLASLVPAGFAASRLTLKTSFSELLPDDKPSVVESRRVNERLLGVSTLTVVALSKDTGALKRFVDEMTPKIRELPPDLVSSVDDGTREVRKFLDRNKHLYADLADIQQIHDDVVERYDWEVSKASGTDLLDEENEDERPPGLDPDELEKRFTKKVDEAKRQDKGVDGYYIGGEGELIGAVLVRTPLSSGSDQAFVLRERIQGIVDAVNPKAFDPNIQVAFTGNLITSAEQHQAVTQDLASVGAWGVGLVLGATFLFFLRLRTLLFMAATIFTGCVWAFGVAYFTVGYLNTATGFLVSIIAGNGINFGIIYMARYIEARRDEKLPAAEAVRVAHRDTYIGTLGAALAAMVAYGSLTATNFHGFKHFGLISGAGMLLCWIASYVLLPAVLVASERIRPMFQDEAKLVSKLRGYYGYPFAWLARALPRTVTLVTLALGVGATVLAVNWFRVDPMEYDMRNVRNERLSKTSAGHLASRVDDVVGRLKQDGKAVLVDHLDQVAPLVAELERRRAAAPEGKKPFKEVFTIFELLPTDQARKLSLLATIKDRLDRGRARGFVSAEDWRKLEPHIPARLAAISVDDIPEALARPFIERDGSRGKIVYIAPETGRSVWDAHYLMEWADSFREVTLPTGEIIRGTGDPVIFSDMLISVTEDAPRAIFLSLVGTTIVILVAFRGRATGFLALATLAIGLAWLLAFLALRGVKLNFLNFVALPISVGVGADYALNVLKRREIEGDGELFRVFVQTGGAVVLCSLTTTLGYVALLSSINRAVRSFGLAAAAGEVTTLVAAMLALPAVLFWQARRQAKRQPPGAR